MIVAAAALGLSACDTSNDVLGTDAAATEVDPITAAISGKTLSSANSKIRLATSGQLTGTAGPNGDVRLAGAWTVRDGQWCRTLNEPTQIAGTECQAATLGDGTITIGLNGPVTYIISD